MAKTNIIINLELNRIEDLKQTVEKVKEAIEKECNCTCTLNVKIIH
ncbi:hypothetical protein SAMN05444401_3584 [Clostridium amylolyticum]|uniref:Uncharacterized protein n=1 Tax=Clostridium amylolyticum TaxID=1121298 RepID=A0A1M6L2L3_9CLOT|nr:hypothetical protein [Clostridium amylolyticum]SHJ65406.1 hypothetical protein SAMN05444401_3584 [Clostridium amylolyticum]